MSFLFWVVRENLIPASVPASRGWLALFGIPWLVGTSPSSLLHLHVAFPFVSSHSSSSVQISLCVQISPYKSHTIGAHPNNFTSTWLFLQKKKDKSKLFPLFSGRVHSEVLGVRTSMYLSLGDCYESIQTNTKFSKLVISSGREKSLSFFLV